MNRFSRVCGLVVSLFLFASQMVSAAPFAYIANGGSTTVSVVDVSTGTVTNTIDVGGGPWGLRVSPDGTRAYVAVYSTNSVAVIDTSTDTVITSVGVGSSPNDLAVSPDGTRVYVANTDTFFPGTVSVIDADTSTDTYTVEGAEIAVQNEPFGMAFSPDGAKVYVGTVGDSTLDVINVSDSSVTTIDFGGGLPILAAFSPDGAQAYVADPNFGNVDVVDTASQTITSSITTGGGPVALAVTPDGGRVYAADFYNGVVFVIDTWSQSIMTTIGVGGLPEGVAFTGDGRTAYVPSRTNNTISVIDTTTNTVQTTLSDPSFNSPVSIAFFVSQQTVPRINSANTAIFTSAVADSFTVTTLAGVPAATTLNEFGALPSGVNFTDNGDGTATLAGTPDAGSIGEYRITITAANSTGSSTQHFTLTVDAASATAVQASTNSIVYGQSVDFTATVSAPAGVGTPTGTVSFYDGVNLVDTETLSGGVAVFTTTALNAGTHTITASYSGDASFLPSSDNVGASVDVAQADTTTSVSVTNSPISLGGSAAVTANVSVTSPGAGTPSGTITVSDGIGDSCTILLPGASSCALTPGDTGTLSVTATYGGDTNFAGSVSSSASLVVLPSTHTVTASSDSNGGVSPASQYIVDGNTAHVTLTPNTGYAAASFGGDCPAGTLSGNVYTTGVISADCGLTVTFAPATLSLSVTDNQEFALYGSELHYQVTLTNSKGNDVSGVSISGNAPSGLDLSAGTWQCIGACDATINSGLFSVSGQTVPANASITWLVMVPVLEDAPGATVDYTVSVTGVGTVAPQTDSDILRIFQDGFDGDN